MKIIIKKIIPFIFLFNLNATLLWSLDPVQVVNERYEEEITAARDLELTQEIDLNVEQLDQSKEAYNTKAIEIEKILFDDKNIYKNSVLEKQNSVIFFHPFFEYDQIDDNSCPPLLEKYSKTHFVMKENIRYPNAQITCSVYKIPDNQNSSAKKGVPIEKKELSKVYTKTFTNYELKNYISDKLSNVDINENLISEEALDAESLFKSRLESKKKNIYANSLFLQENNEDEIIDLSRLLDNLLSFNSSSFIDMEQSLIENRIILKDGYISTFDNETLSETVNENKIFLREMEQVNNEQYGFNSTLFTESVTITQEADTKIGELLGSHYLPIVVFMTKYINIFDKFFYCFLVGGLVLFTYNNTIKLLDRNNTVDNIRNGAKIALMGASFIVLIFTTTSTKDMSLTIYGEEYTINTNVMQNTLAWLSDQASYENNNLTKATFDNYISSLYSDSLISNANINIIARKYQTYSEILGKYEDNIKECRTSYNLDSISLTAKDYFDQQKSRNDIDVNPFPPEQILKDLNKKSIYNSVENYGFSNITKTDEHVNDITQNKNTIQFCYNVHKNYANMLKETKLLEKTITRFNDLELKDYLYSKREIVLENMYINFIKYGYMAAPFLHLQNLMIRLDDFIYTKRQEYFDLLTTSSFDEKTDFIAENSTAYFLLGGNEVRNITTSFFKIGTDATIGIISSSLSSAASSVLGFATSFIYVDMMTEVLRLSKFILAWALGTCLLLITFILKFIVYFLVSFFFIFAFASNARETLTNAMIKVAIVLTTPAIIIFMSYLLLFTLDFISNYFIITTEQMDVFITDDFTKFAVNIAKGAVLILTVALEWVIAWVFLVNGSKIVFTFLEAAAHDVSSNLLNTDQIVSKITK